MYSPSQKGGDYITSTLDPATLTTPDITPSTLSSFGNIGSLNITQISALIDTVNAQIARESSAITSNQTQVTTIQANIDRIPGGLQDIYNIANASYNSVKSAYESAQATLGNDQSTLSTKVGQLAELSSMSSMYTSSLYGYQIEYSSIWNSIQSNNTTIIAEEAEYQERLMNYVNYQTNYDIAVHNLQSTIDALKHNSSILSTATYAYQSTSTAYGNLLEDYVYFSTHNLSTSKYEFMSTNTHLSSLLDYQSTQRGNYISTSSAYHTATLNVEIAQAVYDYRNSLAVEQSTIIKYNNTEVQLGNLIAGIPYLVGGGRVQEGGAHDISYYMNLPPPSGKEIDYQTLYLMLSTMSTAMFSTTRVRQELESNQNVVFVNNLKQILDAADDNIAAAQSAYNTALGNRADVISTMSGLSTRIGLAGIAEQQYQVTLDSLSTIYIRDISTYNGINAEIASYAERENILSSFLRSTLTTLAMLSTQSSMYALSSGTYLQSYVGWSTLEGIAQSSINGYMAIKGNIASTIIGLTTEIGTTSFTVGSQFTNLTASGNTYYSNVIIDINNELDAYKYGIQEWNSFIGYICSEILIQKLNIYTVIDSITFSLQGNNTQSQMDALITQKNAYVTKQQTIQSVLNVLNVLDIQFANLLQLVETERGNKSAFINTRSILTAYEISVFKDPTRFATVQGQYIFQLGNLNSRVNSINANILERNSKLSALNAIIYPQLTIIEGLNILSYTLPEPVNSNLVPFNMDMTEYALLPQLNYGLNQAVYPLVLTHLKPSNVTGTLPSVFYQG
jgi:hypothetical protein